jgi:hypothetical protein
MPCLRVLCQPPTHSQVPEAVRTVGNMRRALRNSVRALLLGAIAFGSVLDPAAAAERAKPLVGTPQVVKDPHWGDVLFYFYQGDYLQALTRLSASQEFQRMGNHTLEAELLKGGLYLSLGEHEEAGKIFKALLNDNVPLDVRNRAWFYLAKIWYQRNYFDDSLSALASIRGALPGAFEPERHLLEANVLMYMERYDEAIRALERWQPVGDRTDVWSAYARFNIGVALVRKERTEDAASLLDAVGRIPTDSEELRSLRDKANVALGYAWLKANRPEEAKTALQRVRLQGPLSNKALLGAGWADSAQQRFTKALAPWLELRGRDMLDAAVQESYLAVPYAYAQLDASSQSAEQYSFAVQAYEQETQRIDESIEAIRAGGLLKAIVENDKEDRVGWYWQLQTLPAAPETRYLYALMASNEFQEGLKNYRDLLLMQKNLEKGKESLGAFENMIETRRRAFEQRAPQLSAVLGSADFVGLEARRQGLEGAVGVIDQEKNLIGFATTREREQYERVKRVEQALADADPNDPATAEMRDKLRLLRGTLLWSFEASYKARLFKGRKELRELDLAYQEATRRAELVKRAGVDYPARTEEFAKRVAGLQPKMQDLGVRLAAAGQAQNRYLAQVAIRELEAQKERLAAYSLQARFALASIYDRASNANPPEQPKRDRE